MTRLMRGTRLALAGGGLLLAALPAEANETLAYTYDALGRMVKVERTGTVNNNASECYSYDPASNRANVNVVVNGACTLVSGGGGGGPTLSVANVSTTEGTSLGFVVSLTGTISGAVTVNYATANGSAAAGSDYTAKSGSLSFATSPSSQTVNVTTTNDTTAESNETVLFNLTSASGATIATSQATGTIIDNDGGGGGSDCTGVSFAVSDAPAVVEADSLVFTITKSGTTSSSCSVNYASANGTAVEPGDYTAVSGTKTFTSAQTSQTVLVSTESNGLTAEPNETVFLNLSGAALNAIISDAQGVGTIIDDGLGDGGCPLCRGAPEGAAPSDGTEDPPLEAIEPLPGEAVDPTIPGAR